MSSSRARTSCGTVLAIYALSYFCSFGNPLAVPLMPFIAEEFSLSPLEVSMLISVYALPGACVLPVFGVLADRLGRKPILIGSLLLCIVSSFMCVMASSYGVLLFWRALQGLSATPLEALCNTLVTDNFQGEQRTRQLGRCMASLYAGAATFPLLSGALLYVTGNWRLSFFIPLAFAALLIPVWFFQPMHYNAKEAPAMQEYMGHVKSVLKSGRLRGFYVARFFMATILFGIIYAYLGVLVTQKLHGSPHMVAPLFSSFTASQAVCCLAVGWMLRHFRPEYVGLAGGLSAATAMLAFLLVPSAGLLLPFLILAGAAQGTLTALVTVGVAGCATQDTRATILSLYSTVFRVSQIVSPVMTGWLFILGSFPLTLGFATLVGLALGLQCYAAFRRVTAGA